MTQLEVIDAARAVLAEPLSTARTFPDNSSGFWRDDTLVTYQNLIHTELVNELVRIQEDYFVTQTSIALTTATRYQLPTDFMKMRRVVGEGGVDDSSTEIRPVTMNDDRAGYYLHGTSLFVTDSAVLAEFSSLGLHYVQRAVDQTANATSCAVLPNEFHPVMVWGIIKLALAQQQTPNEFAVIEFDKQKSLMRQAAIQRQSQRSRSVQRSKWHG